MAKIQAVWAIDVGQAALKALKLVPGETDDKVVAEAFDYVEYPKILSQPDADAEQLVREALGTFMERNDLKGCKVAIAVPGQAGLVKFIKLPPVEKKRIPDIVKFEARQQIPFALEEVIWDYQQIGDEDEGGEEDFTMAEVGLFAMKRDQINRAILPFTVAGIEVDIVQMGPIALYNYVTFDRMKGQEKGAEKGSIVLLDIGADNTDLIISDGTRIWQRNVPIGGNHFTRALTKELKLTFAKGEHLKRNATKAPDPRAVFTAMRSVFNDLASEVNRSIGFYSSVNRTAKIAKIIGLGNGFKLPGLQKFLQQNLSYDVEKLEGFSRLTGDDVLSAPQFQENLMSFAVTYGLGLQGLGLSQLRTNLLPAEMEQVRMIRRKKPWALAASVLLMVGFTVLFVGDWKLWAKVNNPQLQEAAKQAKSVTAKGAEYKSQFDSAKQAWTEEKNVGDALVIDTSEQARWPSFLKTFNAFVPNPVTDLKLDPNSAKDRPLLDKLRVHIDAIKPVWRNDLAAEWFDQLPDMPKTFMHPLDRSKPPSGEGWVVQVIGHHYNPYPARGKAAEKQDPELRKFDSGPLNFLAQVVLPRLWDPRLRAFGVHHATLRWFVKDDQWTSQKELASNGLPSNVPLLARATAPAGESGQAGYGASGGGGYEQMGGQMGGQMAGQMYGKAMGGEMSGMGPSGGYGAGGGYGAMGRLGSGGSGGGYGPGMGATAEADKNVSYMTRTDFVLQLVWQPLKADATPPDIKEIEKEVRDAEKTSKGAIHAVTAEEEKKIETESKAESERALQKALQAAKSAGAAPAPGEAGAPGEAAGKAAPGAAPAATPGGNPPAGAPATPPPVGGAPAKKG